MIGEEILQEIDATLDQLIRNAQAIQSASIQDLSDTEIEAFQKTQESLIQHFLHMDQLLEAKRKGIGTLDKKSSSYKIQEKLTQFETLKSAYRKTIAEATKKQTLPILSKRKAKRFLLI